MTDTSLVPSEPKLSPPPRPRLLRRALIGLGLVAGIGVGGYALAMNGGFHAPWDPARRLEHIQGFSKRLLDGVGATTDQENRIHDVIALAYTAVNKDRKPPEEMRRRLTEIMKAPNVDRSAVESLRAEIATKFDAHSKVIANAIVEAAGQLSADQRGQLADRLSAMGEEHRGFGGWRRHWGEGRPDGSPNPRPNAE